MSGIFISHTHNDQPIADALAKLVAEIFGERVLVNYSSKKEREGGITPGENWFRWIVDQVRDADVALDFSNAVVDPEALGHLGSRGGGRALPLPLPLSKLEFFP